MSELQASNKHGPLVPVLSPLGRKTHLPKSLKCEGKLPASLRHSPSSPQAFDRAACLVKQGKWSLMPGVWRKVVQSLGRSVSNQDGAWQPEERGVWTAGCREQERTLYLLRPSLTISDSEMKGTVRRRQSLSAKGALTSESLMPPPSSLNPSPQQPCLCKPASHSLDMIRESGFNWWHIFAKFIPLLPSDFEKFAQCGQKPPNGKASRSPFVYLKTFALSLPTPHLTTVQ